MKRRARGTGSIRQVGRVWKIRYTLGGRELQETAGPRHEDAVRLLGTRSQSWSSPPLSCSSGRPSLR